MSIGNHGRMMLTGEDSYFICQSSLAILPAESYSSKAGGTSKGNDEFGLIKYLCSYFEVFFNMA
jgi:hypothetical protein